MTQCTFVGKLGVHKTYNRRIEMRKFVVLSVLLAVGCTDTSRTTSTTQTQTQRTVSGSLLSFSDFDLETVVGVVKQNKVTGAKELEKFVNSDNGINNVDVDKDGKVDYIRVLESREGQNIVLDFAAVPSSGGDEVTVANLRFAQNTTSKEVVVEGGYPTYVEGHNSHYYSYRRPGLSFGEAMFLAWLFTPSRSHYYHPVPVYAPRSVLGRSTLNQRRTTTRTTTKVSPVKSTARPGTYAVKSAQKTQSKLKTKGVSTFRKRDATKQKQKASGFGSTTKPTTKPAPKKKSTWGTPRRSKPSRSWGKSSGGRRRSSERYKTSIENLELGLSLIQQLQPVEWKWKAGTDIEMPQIGFIAEDLAVIMPEAVFRNQDNEIEGIDYNLIVIPLVNAVQELKVQNEKLSNDVKQLQDGKCSVETSLH